MKFLFFFFFFINKIIIAFPIFITMSWFLEKLGSEKKLSEKQLTFCHTINISSLLIIPASIIRSTNNTPTSGIIVLMTTVTLWMKLVSYAVVNKENRKLSIQDTPFIEEGN